MAAHLDIIKYCAHKKNVYGSILIKIQKESFLFDYFYLLTVSYELSAFCHLQVGGKLCYLQAKENSFYTITKRRIQQLSASRGS